MAPKALRVITQLAGHLLKLLHHEVRILDKHRACRRKFYCAFPPLKANPRKLSGKIAARRQCSRF